MSIRAILGKWLRPFNSKKYWEMRYHTGGDSGAGSFGELALFKAEVINGLVEEYDIQSVIEWGCGNGEQIQHFKLPQFIGVDISKTAIDACNARYEGDETKQFLLSGEAHSTKAQMAMSLDVLYHLIEEKNYRKYMHQLFLSAEKYVLVYSCDLQGGSYGKHVKPRKFTRYVEEQFKDWKLLQHIPNKWPLEEHGPERGSWSEFFLYEKTAH